MNSTVFVSSFNTIFFFFTARVKTVERQVKLRVTLLDNHDTIIISEEQILHSVSLRIGNVVTIRLPSSSSSTSSLSNRHDSTIHLSRRVLTAIINSNDNYDEKQAIIKQIYDNSLYTVVFNDGDEKSLRRSSLCLQGIRLYQTRINQQKQLLEDMSTTSTFNMPSIVVIQHQLLLFNVVKTMYFQH